MKAKKYSRKRVVYYLFILAVLLVSLPIIVVPSLISSTWFANYLSQKLSESLGREVVIEAPVELRIGPSIDLRAKSIFLSNPKGFKEGRTLLVKDFSLSAPFYETLVGDYQFSSVSASKIDLLIAENEKGDSNWDFSGENADKEEGELKGETTESTRIPSFKLLDFSNFKLRLGAEPDAREFFFKTLRAENLFLSERLSMYSDLLVEGIPLKIRGGASPIEDFLKGEPLEFKIDIDRDGELIDGKGVFQEPSTLKLNLKAHGKDLSVLSPILKIELPAVRDYRLETDLSFKGGEKQELSLENLELQVKKSDLAGNARIVFEPLLVEADLKSKNLDLPDILPSFFSEEEMEAEEISQASQPKVADEEPKERRVVDADVLLDFGNVVFPKDLVLKGLKLSTQIKNSDVEEGKLEAEAFEGSVIALFSSKENDVAFDLNARDINGKTLTTVLTGKPILEGDLNFAADIEMNISPDIQKSLGSLSGRASLTSEGAELESSPLKTASSGLFSILSPIFGESKQAEIECLLFRYDLDNGVAKSKEQVLKLGEVFIFAEGRLDLPKDKISYNFNVNSKYPALASLIPPFRAFGSLSSPSFAPSVSGGVASAFDTAEGATRSAIGLVGGAGRFLVGVDSEKLVGIKLCEKAYQSEQNLVSSRIGKIVDGE
jgi:uncharacterized protein involved in outer membrane biogenesis